MLIRFIASLLAVSFGYNLHAALVFDQNVTNNVIFGTDVSNGNFTIDDGNTTVELGLRAKLRFDAANNPQNTFNSNGDGSYSFQAGLPPTGFGFAPGSTSTAIWNFEWSINSSADGAGGVLSALTYELGIDFDPSAGTNYFTFDPINLAAPNFADHSIGGNSTTNLTDSIATDRTSYLNLIDSNNLAQTSWNMEFFDNSPTYAFNGNNTGAYNFYLEAFDSGGVSVARTEITVFSVPEPSTTALCVIPMVLILFGRRRHAFD